MEIRTLLKANLKSHRGTVLGVFILILLVSLSLGTVLAVALNSSRYVNSEMSRLGYGNLTAWVSGLPDAAPLVDEISALDEVDSVGVQSLIFSEYEIGTQESDSEGQLITYDPVQYPYKFFMDSLSNYSDAPLGIAPGEIYVPASMASMFDIRVGDTITFPIARSGGDMAFTVAGFFEDPFMGSSMIGMKGFLICRQDHEEIAGMIRDAGADSLAREGFMLHIFQSEGSDLAASQFNAVLNEKTSLQGYVEFTHSREAISGFMLTLQNVFASLLLAFVAILLLYYRTGLYQYGGPQNLGGHQWEAARNTAFAVPYYSLMRYGGGDAALAPGNSAYFPDDGDNYGPIASFLTAHRGLLSGFGSGPFSADGFRLALHQADQPDFPCQRYPGDLEGSPKKQKGGFPHSKRRASFLACPPTAFQR